MILTDLYVGLNDANTKTRYDVVLSTGSYDFFEQILINKKKPNVGGLSFYYVDTPKIYGNRRERKSDKAITKSSLNISSVYMPDPSILLAYGDVNHTQDALIINFSPDWQTIEIYIARGQKNNKLNLFNLAVDGELDEEMDALMLLANKGLGNKNSDDLCENPDSQYHD